MSASITATAYGARRIACLQPSATVILNALGELERVVACTKYCADVVVGIEKTSPVILADSWTANAEQIMSSNADMVIAAVPYQEKAVVEILKAGVRFLGLAPKTLADIYGDIAAIAGLVGAGSRGDEVIAKMEFAIADVRRKTANAGRKRVFCEEWGKPLISSQPWVAELVEAAGGTIVGVPGRQASFQEIRHLDPEVVIAAWCGAGDRVPLEKIVAEREWGQTSAGRSGDIFCVRDEYLNTPAPTLLLGLEALAFAIHPELFSPAKGIRRITGVRATVLPNRSR
jgi:iron complex transport system substrate-binding protein